MMMAASGAFAMSGTEHANEWNESFGILDAQSKQNIKPLWDTAQKVLDDYHVDYQKLRKKFPWFSFGDKTHRLLFHWGFNRAAEQHPPLVRQVKECLDKYLNEEKNKSMTHEEKQQFKKDESRKFFKYVMKELEDPRKRALKLKVVNTTGIPTSRGYANAVATIIYDIHILADYETSKTSGLMEIKPIMKELVSGFNRLTAGADKTERLDQISEQLDEDIRAGRGRTNMRRAKLLRETTKKFLPQILNERFQNTLRARGIVITVPESK